LNIFIIISTEHGGGKVMGLIFMQIMCIKYDFGMKCALSCLFVSYAYILFEM